jgi:hypothetical protein
VTKLSPVVASAFVLALVPASIGLIGNVSFSEDVPVRPPETAVLLDSSGSPMPRPPRSTSRSDDDAEPGDDHGGQGRGHASGAGPSQRATASPTRGDGDRHGGSGTEPGDDRGPGPTSDSPQAVPEDHGDDRSGHGGSDDRSDPDDRSGSDHHSGSDSGSGGDDGGSGSDGHGGDDG